jgi:hypothetical protein
MPESKNEGPDKANAHHDPPGGWTLDAFGSKVDEVRNEDPDSDE